MKILKRWFPAPVLLLIGVILLLVSRGSLANQTSTTARYRTYIFAAHLSSETFHPGDRISVVWQPEAQWTTNPASAHVQLQTKLFGPFPSIEVLKLRMGGSSSATQPIVLTSIPITTTTSTNQTFTDSLALPQHLEPGYYAPVFTMTQDQFKASSTGILQITP